MAQRNVLQQPKHAAKTNRNWFDMSHHVIFSDSIGLLSPVACFETIPNEHYKISIDSFCRSQAVNTSSFMRVKEQYDVFSVPIRLLWSYADQFFSQISNYTSVVFSNNQQGKSPVRTPLIDYRAFQADGQIVTAAKESDEFELPKQFGFDRIFHQLEYGIWQSGDDIANTQFINDNFSRNPFRAAAYQKIYHDYFQNTDYEDIPVECYNLDYSPGGVIAPQNQYLRELFRLRYRDRRKDFFTVVKPSFNLSPSMPYLSSVEDNIYYGGNTDALPQAPNSVKNLIDDQLLFNMGGYRGTSTDSRLAVGKDFTAGSSVDYSNADDTMVITAQNIRAILAFDRLNQNIGLGGRDYRSQIESRFGVKLPQLRSDKCIYLGSFDGSVVVSEVLATNGDDLGQIGGKGTGSVNGRQIEFDSLEHSIIMVIHSFLPYTDYYATMLDRHNTKSEFLDYFQPELDNLGAQPQYGYELDTREAIARQREIVGFVPRFIEDKTKVNKVFGADFANAVWTALSNPYSPVRKGYAALKVNPKDFNSQFGIAFDGTSKTDQFICRAMINCTKLSPMSVYGLPNYQ